MAKEKPNQGLSAPAELEVPEDNDTQPKVQRLTDKQVLALEKELGIKRQTAIIDKQRQEIGEGLYFDELVEDDPTGESARSAFAWETVTVDLGEQADRVTFDRKQYFHGYTYKVRRYQLAGFNEVMWASKRHDAEVNGQARGLRQTKKNFRLGRDGAPRPGN